MCCGLSSAQRREALTAVHGQPVQVDTAPALRLLGIRGEVHPDDAIAFAYRDQAAAGAYAASNAAHHGVPSLGTATSEAGVIGVLDLRPALAGDPAYTPADPRLPDPPVPRRRPPPG